MYNTYNTLCFNKKPKQWTSHTLWPFMPRIHALTNSLTIRVYTMLPRALTIDFALSIAIIRTLSVLRQVAVLLRSTSIINPVFINSNIGLQKTFFIQTDKQTNKLCIQTHNYIFLNHHVVSYPIKQRFNLTECTPSYSFGRKTWDKKVDLHVCKLLHWSETDSVHFDRGKLCIHLGAKYQYLLSLCVKMYWRFFYLKYNIYQIIAWRVNSVRINRKGCIFVM